MEKEIIIKVCGKWIWAGEYSVLYGYPALAFPLSSQFIELKWKQDEKQGLTFQRGNKNSASSEFISSFENILDKALYKISKAKSDLAGTVIFKCCLLMGAGLGASAVMCVLIGRLFQHFGWIKEAELFSFCHSLENIIHGESSGLDVAAVLINQPIFYKKVMSSKKTTLDEQNNKNLYSEKHTRFLKPDIQVLTPKWYPKVFVSHSGSTSSTQESIKVVQLFRKKQPSLAQKLDQQMERSVIEAKKALESRYTDESLKHITQSFLLAEQCFSEWNLISEQMRQQMDLLKKNGALTVKPTGSGAGGCLLSLWDKHPDSSLKNSLISAF